MLMIWVRSSVTVVVIAFFRVLITPLTATHEPPSRVQVPGLILGFRV